MITPELIEYIKGEIAKGKTREAISVELVKSGWTEIDLSEAFRTVIPMQSSAVSSATLSAPALKKETKLSKKALENIIFIVVAIACVLTWYFYRPQIINFWNSGIERSQELSVNSWNWLENSFKKISLPSFDFKKMFGIGQASNESVAVNVPVPVPQNNPIIKKTVVRDCGTTNSPDLENSLTYQNNAVLNCLGNSALSCTPAKAVIKDALFPTMFQIVRNQNIDDNNTCNFQLSYGADSTLVDITGKKLAEEDIMCPISIVKRVDETKNTPSYNAPNLNNPSQYAGQIYFYGTLGLFMENNADKNKIQSLGCSGSYIDTVVASYKKMQGKK